MFPIGDGSFQASYGQLLTMVSFLRLEACPRPGLVLAGFRAMEEPIDPAHNPMGKITKTPFPTLTLPK